MSDSKGSGLVFFENIDPDHFDCVDYSFSPKINKPPSSRLIMTRSLEEVLQSASDVLFPAELGEAPVTVDSRGYDGDTALHVMAWRKDVGGARILLAAGADVNAIGEMHETPLHVAITQDDIAMIELLLGAGATVTNKSEFENTELQGAENKGGAVWKLVKRAAKNDV